MATGKLTFKFRNNEKKNFMRYIHQNYMKMSGTAIDPYLPTPPLG